MLPPGAGVLGPQSRRTRMQEERDPRKGTV